VLRNALPGSPPLGVAADMWVFLWAELATVLALALVVFKWAKAGPRPSGEGTNKAKSAPKRVLAARFRRGP
jgi:Domain of unknown function (DUF4436)